MAAHPEVMKAFSSIAQAALAAKALDSKTKELIAVGIAVALRCDDCIAFHDKAAFEQGASRGEVIERLAWHGDLHGRRPFGAVCQPRARSIWSVRGSRDIGARRLNRPR